jgi:hypothetical protein
VLQTDLRLGFCCELFALVIAEPRFEASTAAGAIKAKKTGTYVTVFNGHALQVSYFLVNILNLKHAYNGIQYTVQPRSM